MAAAATRRPIASKKRKVSADLHHSTDDEPMSKKKSPLFNKPQNFYAPPSITSMTKDELSEWRKEERRRRNRESAAASRNKIKGRIEELEGEVSEWKHKYAEMEKKMRCMERHIQFLTKLNGSSTPSGGVSPPSPQTVSHPNSPPRSPVPEPIPNTVTSSFTQPPPPYSSHVANVPNLFPPLLSEPKDSTKVETQKANVNPAVVTANNTVTTAQESKKHINLISRQAVKSGANFDSSLDKTVIKQHQQQEKTQLSGLPTCDSTVKDKKGEDVVNSSTPDVMSVEATNTVNDVMNHQGNNKDDDPPTLESSSPESSDDDEDFLDLLVDTLDGEFDPQLMI